jgi:subtilisin
MAKKNLLAVILTLTMLLSLVVVFPAVAATQGNPAAPAIATQLLKEWGVKGNLGAYISAVAGEMGPGTTFQGVEKWDETYRAKVEVYLTDLGLNPNALVLSSRSNGDNGMTKVFIGFNKKPGSAEESLVRAAGGNVRYRYNLIPAIAAELPEQAIAALERNPNVTNIQPDIKAYLFDVYQDELDRTWGVKHIGAGTVHKDKQFGTGVKVAVIDTGINYNHPDLAANFTINNRGYDFADRDNDPMDVNGHGTHIAGTIAALMNGQGAVGVAPGVQLYALKVFGDDGSAYYSDIVSALEWAVNNGIKVTNNSYGSTGNPGPLVEKAFANAYAKGVLHVAAAGNQGNALGNSDTVSYPARFSSVIAVAATGQDNKRPKWSSTGPDVELSAPGVSIYSTLVNGYGTLSGTSMASPHVAGVAALVIDASIGDVNNNGYINDEVRERLISTADDLGNLYHYGHGLVNAVAAVAGGISAPTHYTLTVGKYGEGTTSPMEGNHVYEDGTQVTLTATPAEGWIFVKWSVNGTDTINNVTTVTMNADKSAVAYFEEVTPPGSPTKLNMSVSTSGKYTYSSWVQITVEVTGDDAVAVLGAAVSATIKDSNGSIVFSGTGTTDATGNAYFSYRIPNKAPTGTYTVNADATKDNESCTGTASFLVKRR